MLLFAGGLAFFGVFFAVPLRRQTILREKLVFPSGMLRRFEMKLHILIVFRVSHSVGTATAELIKILHNTKGREGTA